MGLVVLKEELPQFLSNWRTVPRLMMVLYGFAFYEVVTWFMALENPNNLPSRFSISCCWCGGCFRLVYMSTARKLIFKSSR